MSSSYSFTITLSTSVVQIFALNSVSEMGVCRVSINNLSFSRVAMVSSFLLFNFAPVSIFAISKMIRYFFVFLR